MTCQLTPRQDRMRLLAQRITALTNELDRLIAAEEPEEIPPTMLLHRTQAARRQLLEWARTTEFADRVAAYGGPSGDEQTTEQEAS